MVDLCNTIFRVFQIMYICACHSEHTSTANIVANQNIPEGFCTSPVPEITAYAVQKTKTRAIIRYDKHYKSGVGKIMKEKKLKLQREIRTLPLKEGHNPTGIPCVTAYQFTTEKIQMPQIKNPYLYIVLDGTLRLHTPSGIMDYMAGQYSISKIDTPTLGTVLTFSERQDFLAVSVEIPVSDVITVILDLDNDLLEKIMCGQQKSHMLSTADCAVIDAVSRLFPAIKQAIPSEFIRKNIMREVIYYVLCGTCGRPFIQSIVNIGQADTIYEANSWIKENFRNSFTVQNLAEQRNMSVSQFHQKFKSAVGMGPLQCQKRLRLTEARRLMLDDGKNVTEASLAVGYESLSQFIRDYRKMFGSAPKEDILNMQRRLKK